MNRKELADELTDLIEYYYEKVEDVQDLRSLYELNWYCKDRLMNIGYKAFNETWGNGWTTASEENTDETK